MAEVCSWCVCVRWWWRWPKTARPFEDGKQTQQAEIFNQNNNYHFWVEWGKSRTQTHICFMSTVRQRIFMCTVMLQNVSSAPSKIGGNYYEKCLANLCAHDATRHCIPKHKTTPSRNSTLHRHPHRSWGGIHFHYFPPSARCARIAIISACATFRSSSAYAHWNRRDAAMALPYNTSLCSDIHIHADYTYPHRRLRGVLFRVVVLLATVQLHSAQARWL